MSPSFILIVLTALVTRSLRPGNLSILQCGHMPVKITHFICERRVPLFSSGYDVSILTASTLITKKKEYSTTYSQHLQF